MKIRQWTEKAEDREQWRGCQGGSPRAVAPGGWMDGWIVPVFLQL